MAALRLLVSSCGHLGLSPTAAAGPLHTRFRPPCRGHRMTPSDDEQYQRTTVSALERSSPDAQYIEAYSRHGFTISGNRVMGPCAVIPQALLQWNVGSYRDVSVDSLALFYLLEPKIEILVLGLGDRVHWLDPNLLTFMRSKGIGLEILDTPNACATFNFLTSERPSIAAALIPPGLHSDQR
ncbi:NADH dehydrogenase [ubiquinone] 1 alpha subcomplex assembly factor 3 [Amblyraja radiata]|uniref:NADH dehydrogenase [ubiquinone] 1 alpha subcomplex assembly factor 3 n=1 Tax=Amblyraja radiata TaxID=386614 RepID=UPI001402DC0F|nr:NADH dehydrogenase [ubiquinone] 1 alpha subcomplex assembly factor 3 [Amblyraja radiata]